MPNKCAGCGIEFAPDALHRIKAPRERFNPETLFVSEIRFGWRPMRYDKESGGFYCCVCADMVAPLVDKPWWIAAHNRDLELARLAAIQKKILMNPESDFGFGRPPA